MAKSRGYLATAALVNMVLGELSTTQLHRMAVCVALDQDPRKLKFWGRVSDLFTEEDQDGVPRMNLLVQQIVDAVVNKGAYHVK